MALESWVGSEQKMCTGERGVFSIISVKGYKEQEDMVRIKWAWRLSIIGAVTGDTFTVLNDPFIAVNWRGACDLTFTR